MSRFRLLPRSLYVRIAAVYLVLLLALSLISALVAVRGFQSFTLELGQNLNRDVAGSLATRLAPAFSHDPPAAVLRQVASHVHMVNPSLDLWVLGGDGRVLASSVPGPLPAQKVALGPIHAFLEHARPFPIRGQDPSAPGQRKVFSVAAIGLPHGQSGYLYVLLRGMGYQSAAGMIEGSYILHDLAITLLIALGFTGVVGLVLFGFITRRFRRLTDTVAGFTRGEYDRRVGDRRRDEIGQLGSAFDGMAATISAQVQALRQTDSRRRRLVANLSHDLRTPLTSLLGYAQHLLHRPDTDAAERERQLQAIVTDGHQLTHLVEQLATLSRLDVQQADAQMEPFLPGELAQDLIVKFQPAASEVGVRLEDGAGHALPQVMGDIGLVERALANLVDNALAHTPRGGRVALELSWAEGGVGFCVSDNGCGIPEDEIKLVTQRFYRTRASREQGKRGSGLGLAIVKEIMDAHGTHLVLTSAGSGTCASFTLPLA